MASYPLQDALGSICLRTDGSRAVTSTCTWDSWGNARTTPSGNLFGWTGKPRDPTTNLVCLSARDYSPGTGRFLTGDSLESSVSRTRGYIRYTIARTAPVEARRMRSSLLDVSAAVNENSPGGAFNFAKNRNVAAFRETLPCPGLGLPAGAVLHSTRTVRW